MFDLMIKAENLIEIKDNFINDKLFIQGLKISYGRLSEETNYLIEERQREFNYLIMPLELSVVKKTSEESNLTYETYTEHKLIEIIY